MQRELITGKIAKVTEMIRDKNKLQESFTEYYYSKSGASHKANGENDIKHTYARMTDKLKRNLCIHLVNPTAIRLRAKLEKMRK